MPPLGSLLFATLTAAHSVVLSLSLGLICTESPDGGSRLACGDGVPPLSFVQANQDENPINRSCGSTQ